MDKTYAKASEKYVMSFMLYGKKNDTFLYSDKEMKSKATYDEVLNVSTKGFVVSYDGSICMPLSVKVESSKVTVNIATVATSAVTPVALTSDTKQA